MKSLQRTYIFIWFYAFCTDLCISLTSKQDVIVIPHPPTVLEVSVYDVSLNSVEIDWYYKEDKSISDLSCELVYGPVDDVSQVQVFTQIQLADNHIIKLSHLDFNVTYHMHIVCHNGTGDSIQSNTVQFTTGSKSLLMNYMMPSDTFHEAVHRGNYYSPNDESFRNIRTSNVVLGSVCGLIGFLIINVTIVMVVRKCSHYHMRRQRILEIEERDYDEIPYVREE